MKPLSFSSPARPVAWCRPPAQAHFLIGLLCLSLSCPGAPAAHNILLLIADDYGADSSSLYNGDTAASLPPTPNLTALARSGVVFANAYANPLCSPTRACLITGRHSFRTGIGYAISGALSPSLTSSEFTLPEAFAANATLGYQLAQFGKWHLNNVANSPNTIGGWPHFAGCLTAALANYTNWAKTVNGLTTAGYRKYATTDVVDDAIAWITARGNQPWFAWVAFNAGHTPLHKPPEHLHSYQSLTGTATAINANPRPYFEAMIEAMDTEIGRLLTVVDRTHTHVIFLGDNGTTANVIQPPYPSRHAKGTVYEGGTRVPLFIAGPAVVNPGRTNRTPVHAVDLFSTLLELAGVNPATTLPVDLPIDSQSLMPMLQQESETTRYVYTEVFGAGLPNTPDGQALRNGQFKLIRFADGRQEFYDLLADPYEGTNLLAGALLDNQQANYFALTLRLGYYQDDLAPPVPTSYERHDSRFSIVVRRTMGLRYRLWRASTYDDLAWAPLARASVVTNSDATVTLTDLEATGLQSFYHVEASR